VGAGEFLDLEQLVDICAATGFSLIQVLPVSDTSVRGTWRDSYPYSSLCVFALHPLYLRLQALAGECRAPGQPSCRPSSLRAAVDNKPLHVRRIGRCRPSHITTLPAHPTIPSNSADSLPQDIEKEIEAARRELEAVEGGVDYERTMEVGWGGPCLLGRCWPAAAGAQGPVGCT
jgi:hypothetical protein